VTEIQPRIIMGVDGGGTKTRVWLARVTTPDTFKVIGKGLAGPSNVQSGDSTEALANVQLAVDAAKADSGLAVEQCEIDTVCMALAGSGTESSQALIHSWAAQVHLAKHVIVTHDAMAVLYAANYKGVGVALIAGTGSIAFGRNRNEQTARCGGLGPHISDAGSGFAIAMAALKEGLKIDGAEMASSQQVADMQRFEIAALAQLVFQASDAGDEQAFAVMTAAVHDLTNLVIHVAEELELADRLFTLGLSGGVLIHRADARAQIMRELSTYGLTASAVVITDPVMGALQIALRSLNDA
jgi:N-acetylglucosamine kinase-like BadF-type ATPase